MSKMLTHVPPRIRAMETRLRGKSGRGPTTQSQIRKLRARVADLEMEVIENRQLARRIAELTDVVEQLLLTRGERSTLEAEREGHKRKDPS